ncbi:MAG: ABC transporter substrate-binding protein [Eubacteriales bacterium]|nr:ABC transporter substrate-binding protein [Eubacteriales bacterium]
MRKKFLSMLLMSAMTVSMLVGCGNSSSTSEETKEETTAEAEGGTFIVPINATSIKSLTPYSIYGSDDGQMAAAPCFDPLYIVTKDETRWYLAESIEETADDGCHYQLKLKDGVKWHDGEEFNADDVVYTINMLLDPANGGSPNESVCYDGKTISAEKVDDLTVDITLQEPFSGFVSELGRIRVIAEHIFGGETNVKDMTDELATCVGTGPFKFVEYNEGESIVYERNDDYYREPAKLDQVVIKLMPDLSAQEAALQNGEISMMRVTSQTKLDKYKEDSNYTVYTIPEGRLNYLAFNYQTEIMKNDDARKAICLALNAEEIVTGAYGSEELAIPAKNFCSPQNLYFNDEMTGYEQDLEEAKALAEKSGLTDMTLKYIYFTQRPNMKETAQIVQQQLEKIGVKVEIEGFDNGEFFMHLFAAWITGETVEDTSWDIASNGMDSLNADPATKMTSWKGDLIQNGFYMSDATTELWEKAAQSLDETEREQLYKDLQVQMNEDYSFYPMANTNYVIVSRKEFKGLDTVLNYPIFEDYTVISMEQ